MMKILIFTFLLSFTAFSNTVDELLKECSPNATIKRLGNQYDEDRFDYEISVSHIKISLGEEYISGALGNQKIKGRENREKWIYHEKNGFDDPLSHYDEEDEEVDEEDKESYKVEKEKITKRIELLNLLVKKKEKNLDV